MITVKKEQPVTNVVSSDSVSLDSTKAKYGVWAFGRKGYRGEVLKLTAPIPDSGKRYWYFTKMSGNHSGWSNHGTIADSIDTLVHEFDVVIPETKEELIKLLQDNLK